MEQMGDCNVELQEDGEAVEINLSYLPSSMREWNFLSLVQGVLRIQDCALLQSFI